MFRLVIKIHLLQVSDRQPERDQAVEDPNLFYFSAILKGALALWDLIETQALMNC